MVGCAAGLLHPLALVHSPHPLPPPRAPTPEPAWRPSCCVGGGEARRRARTTPRMTSGSESGTQTRGRSSAARPGGAAARVCKPRCLCCCWAVWVTSWRHSWKLAVVPRWWRANASSATCPLRPTQPGPLGRGAQPLASLITRTPAPPLHALQLARYSMVPRAPALLLATLLLAAAITTARAGPSKSGCAPGYVPVAISEAMPRKADGSVDQGVTEPVSSALLAKRSTWPKGCTPARGPSIKYLVACKLVGGVAVAGCRGATERPRWGSGCRRRVWRQPSGEPRPAQARNHPPTDPPPLLLLPCRATRCWPSSRCGTAATEASRPARSAPTAPRSSPCRASRWRCTSGTA